MCSSDLLDKCLDEVLGARAAEAGAIDEMEDKFRELGMYFRELETYFRENRSVES